MLKEYTIDMIQSFTEKDARDMDSETLSIKGHNVYLVDLKGYFGYSALVFADGQHIHYANDYELHHKKIYYTDDGKMIDGRYSRTELRDLYIRNMNLKLFTEDEIRGPIANYSDYQRKEEYLRDYYGMRRPYVSIFCINTSEAEEASFRDKTSKMILDPVSFAYYDASERDFVEHHISLLNALECQKNALSGNFEYWKDAFLNEMFNHEYGINWQADYDTLSAFGNLSWSGDDAGPDVYMKQLQLNETQQTAYYAARSEYFRTANL